MITPKFRLEQTDIQIKIFIEAPYVNVKDTEIHVLDNDFRFYSKPYYLRLNLPGNIVENDNSIAKYEADTQSFQIEVDKQTPGEHFTNLDMLTVLLQPKKKNKEPNRPLIQVLSSNDDEPSAEIEDTIEGDEWYMEQSIEDAPSQVLTNQYPYGFALLHSGLGTKFKVELAEVCELENPDSQPLSKRRELREIKEKEKFSDEHYLVDLLFTPEITSLLKIKLQRKKFIEINDTARQQMKNFNNREFLLDKPNQKRCYLSMIDILFAYLFDYRLTKGAHCIETPWNISRISSTLSWFEVLETINDVVRSSLRRSLSYPLYRHWELSLLVFQDVLKILELGKLGVLNCFLKVHALFTKKDPYYLLNQLYIEDYCVWIQQTKEESVKNLASVLSEALTRVKKEDLDFDLVELEAAGYSEQEEMEIAEVENQVTQGVSRLRL